MSIARDDPRLTAYALDEMSAPERAAFEVELKRDPAARADVQSIRELAGRIDAELSRVPEAGLTARQRRTVERAAAGRRGPVRAWHVVAVAATILIAVGFALQEPEVHEDAATTSLSKAAPESALADGERRLEEMEERPSGMAADPADQSGDATAAIARSNNAEANEQATKKEIADAESTNETINSGSRTPEETEALRRLLEREYGKSGYDGTETDSSSLKDDPRLHSKPGSNAPKKDPMGATVLLADSGDEEDRLELEHRVKIQDRIHFGTVLRVRTTRGHNTEAYDPLVDNPFRRVVDESISTFSIDVDTASYSNVRRFLNGGRLPPRGAVRIEEMVNYFRYDYAPPAAGSPHPFRAHVEIAACPWNTRHRLARIGLKGRVVEAARRPASNLVFLVDVSGSMQDSNKLPLVRQTLQMLVRELDERDRVAIAVYAGAAGLVLPSTPCHREDEILAAIGRLQAGGSTNGGEGILLAYRTAAASFLKDGVNRVILATDGDFNVGVTDRSSLVRLIEEKAKGGIFLSILGYGVGNLKDARMEELSNKGNGNYAYIDSLAEAKKVLVEQMTGTLVTVARDVKIQVMFNPKRVAGYRLIGYANRMLRKEDFNDDTKDAGEIGAGHEVTALYEIVPATGETVQPKADGNPFVEQERTSALADQGASFRLRLRYKPPTGDTSLLMETDVKDGGAGFDRASRDFRWAATVAAFGMLLRDSSYRGAANWEALLEIARSSVGADALGYRAAFLGLLGKVRQLKPTPKPVRVKEEVRKEKEKERAGGLVVNVAKPAVARVTAVKDALVTISIGSDAGVRNGDTFHLRRGVTICGTIRITTVHRKMSVGELTVVNIASGNAPKAGDTVHRSK